MFKEQAACRQIQQLGCRPEVGESMGGCQPSCLNFTNPLLHITLDRAQAQAQAYPLPPLHTTRRR